MYEGHLKKQSFNNAWLAQVAGLTMNPKVVGSNPNVSKNFSFCIILPPSRSSQLDWAHTNKSKHDIHPRYKERKIILKKMAA